MDGSPREGSEPTASSCGPGAAGEGEGPATDPAPLPPAPPEPREATWHRALFLAHEQDLGHRVKWVHFWRLVVALVCLGILLIYEGGSPRSYPAAYALVVAIFPLTIVYLVLLPRTRDLERLVAVQVAIDVLFETGLVYLTGGVQNVGFTFLYFLSILTASLLLSSQAGFVVASVATVLQASVAVAYWIAHGYETQLPLVTHEVVESLEVQLRWNTIVSNLVGSAAGYHLVAALSGLLPNRVGRARLLYDEILDALREGLVALDNAGRVVFVNREARRLLGWEDRGRLVGRRYEDLIESVEERRILELFAREEDVHEELDVEIRGKGTVAVEVKTAVLRTAGGRLRGVIGTIADATLDHALSAMEQRLARLEGTQEMSLGLAHELRNPLASIRGAVQELVREGDPRFSEDDLKLAGVVRHESDRLDRLIEEYLVFARVRPPERRPVDLARVIDETVLLLSARQDARDVGITCDLEARDDRRPAAYVILGDAGQLRQAILNIGVNALQALRGKGKLLIGVRETTIPSRAALPGGSRSLASRRGVEITIDDDGPGVPLDMREKVFTPFVSTRKDGLGLGLSIVQKVVRDHEGDVACETPPWGKGTRFRVTLPLAGSAGGIARTPSSAWKRPVLGKPVRETGRTSRSLAGGGGETRDHP